VSRSRFEKFDLESADPASGLENRTTVQPPGCHVFDDASFHSVETFALVPAQAPSRLFLIEESPVAGGVAALGHFAKRTDSRSLACRLPTPGRP
jgi:hypothetical protein